MRGHLIVHRTPLSPRTIRACLRGVAGRESLSPLTLVPCQALWMIPIQLPGSAATAALARLPPHMVVGLFLSRVWLHGTAHATNCENRC